MHRHIKSFPVTFAENKFFKCDCPYQARLTISVFLWTRLVPAPWDGNEALPAGPLSDSCCVASSLLALHSKNKEVGGVCSTQCPWSTHTNCASKKCRRKYFSGMQIHRDIKIHKCTQEQGCVMNMKSRNTHNLILCVFLCTLCTHTRTHAVTQTQLPCCFQAQGAGEKRLPNFPSWSTRLHMQMLITTGACMGQSAGCWNSLCIALSPHRSPFPRLLPWLIIKIITSDFLHGSFSPARFWKARAPLSDFPRWALISAPGPRTGAGGQVDTPPATHSPEGTDSFSQSLRYGGVMSARSSIRYGVIVVGIKAEMRAGSDQMRSDDGCYHTDWQDAEPVE